MSKKMIMIGFVVAFFVPCFVFAMGYKPSIKEIISVDGNMISYEIKNAIVFSKEQADKGFNLLYEKERPEEAKKYLPSIKIHSTKSYGYAGFIIDKYDNVFSKTEPYQGEGKEVEYLWGCANQVLNGEYRFYIELWAPYVADGREYNKKVASFLSKPFIINIPGNDPPKGFYIISPMEPPLYSGLHAPFSISDKPILAWVDTINNKVVKYQIFDSAIQFQKELLPLVDNVYSDKRSVSIDPEKLKNPKISPRNQDSGPGPTGFDSIIVRAIYQDGLFKDTEGSVIRINVK